MSSLDTCFGCLAPYTLTCSVLLFLMSHLLTNGSWTFEVLAAKHHWDVKEKARCCRNAAIFYLFVSISLLSYCLCKPLLLRVKTFIMEKALGRRSDTARVRAALLDRYDLGGQSRRRMSSDASAARGWRGEALTVCDMDDEDMGFDGGKRAVREMMMMTAPARLRRDVGPLSPELDSDHVASLGGFDTVPSAKTLFSRSRVGERTVAGPDRRQQRRRGRGYASHSEDSNDADDLPEVGDGYGGFADGGGVVVLAGSPRPSTLTNSRGYDSGFGSDMDQNSILHEQQVVRQRAFARLHSVEDSADERRYRGKGNNSSGSTRSFGRVGGGAASGLSRTAVSPSARSTASEEVKTPAALMSGSRVSSPGAPLTSALGPRAVPFPAQPGSTRPPIAKPQQPQQRSGPSSAQQRAPQVSTNVLDDLFGGTTYANGAKEK